ncbi:MAG: hypothetical protein ACFE8E_12715 [Candidatus Hodarchaeota archaeon]
MARASALLQNKEDFEKFNELAMKGGEGIKNKEDKKYFFEDLSGGPWFGMK